MDSISGEMLLGAVRLSMVNTSALLRAGVLDEVQRKEAARAARAMAQALDAADNRHEAAKFRQFADQLHPD